LGNLEDAISFIIPKEILLLETEPEIVVVVLDCCTAIGLVRRAVGVEDFAHDEEAVLATGIFNDCTWLQ